MKKQLLIAAVAATMTSAAFADISLSGQATVKAQTSGGAAVAAQNEVRLSLKGTSGENTVVVTMEANSDSFAIEESYVSTKLEGFTVIAGVKNGRTQSALVKNKTASAKFIIKADVAGAKITLKQGSGDANAKVDVSTSIAGADVTVKNVLADSRYFLVDADVAGIAVHYEGDNTNKAYSLSGNVAGIALTYASVDAANNDNRHQDSAFDNTVGLTGVTGVIASTSTAAGKLTVKRWSADQTATSGAITKVLLKRGNATYFIKDTATTDATIGAKIKFTF